MELKIEELEIQQLKINQINKSNKMSKIKYFILFFISQVTVALSYNDTWVWNEEKEKWEYCHSGYYCVNGSMYECPDGYYSDVWQSECTKCGCDNCLKANIYDEKTNKVIKYAGSCPIEGSCYPGYGLDPINKVCEICEIGRFSEGGSNECETCPFGSFNTKKGLTGCKQCPLFYGSNVIHNGCELCAPGLYYDFERHSCKMCPNHSISTDYNQTACTPCGKDEYSKYNRRKCLPKAKRKIRILCDSADYLRRRTHNRLQVLQKQEMYEECLESNNYYVGDEPDEIDDDDYDDGCVKLNYYDQDYYYDGYQFVFNIEEYVP